MISRSIFVAAMIAAGTSAALAEVEVKAPGVQVEAPAGDVGLNVNVGAKNTPSEAWVGRTLYSSDGKSVGEIAAVAGDQIYADMGGFLGLGETRVLLSPDQIASVQDDRIVLALTETEAKGLPSVDQKPAVTE